MEMKSYLPNKSKGKIETYNFMYVPEVLLLEDLGDIDLTNIQWVIVGGELGPKARPMKPEWVERIKQQCDNHKTSFFLSNGAVGAQMGKNDQKKQMRDYYSDVHGITCPMY